MDHVSLLVAALFFGAAAPIGTLTAPSPSDPLIAATVPEPLVIEHAVLETVSSDKVSTASRILLNRSLERVHRYDTLIEAAAAEMGYEVDPLEIQAIIMVESQGNPFAHNPRTDARGLGQITPVGLKELRRQFKHMDNVNRYNAQDNIRMVAHTLWILEHRYGISDPLERVCAYNEGAVGAQKYRGMFDRHLYVQKVGYAYSLLVHENQTR